MKQVLFVVSFVLLPLHAAAGESWKNAGPVSQLALQNLAKCEFRLVGTFIYGTTSDMWYLPITKQNEQRGAVPATDASGRLYSPRSQVFAADLPYDDLGILFQYHIIPYIPFWQQYLDPDYQVISSRLTLTIAATGARTVSSTIVLSAHMYRASDNTYIGNNEATVNAAAFRLERRCN